MLLPCHQLTLTITLSTSLVSAPIDDEPADSYDEHTLTISNEIGSSTAMFLCCLVV